MYFKIIYTLTTLACLLSLTTNLEAKHSKHHSHVKIVNHTYTAPTYTETQYVVREYGPQTVYVREPVYYPQPTQTVVYQEKPVYYPQPAQTIIYREEPVVYKERVIVRERSNPASLITSFALGLGLGLLR